MIKLYGYKKCGTCRKAEKAFAEMNIEYTFIDVTEQPPSAAALEKMVKQAKVEYKKLLNTSGIQYRELKIKDKLPGMTNKEIVQMLAENGRLIKRPLATDGNKTTIGFKEDIFRAAWERK
ncbi:MAG: Spx/MgsR family RNA polymerase-binding regulatory protein [Gammaproteobacteria bacterium]|nr:Spx/MgsR family RNA polymerase-binding regulatory protein [Gammaproteobacteria bacterium]